MAETAERSRRYCNDPFSSVRSTRAERVIWRESHWWAAGAVPDACGPFVSVRRLERVVAAAANTWSSRCQRRFGKSRPCTYGEGRLMSDQQTHDLPVADT